MAKWLAKGWPVLGVPLAWFPRLLHSPAAQRKQLRISPHGLHWDALDEDISLSPDCWPGKAI